MLLQCYCHNVCTDVDNNYWKQYEGNVYNCIIILNHHNHYDYNNNNYYQHHHRCCHNAHPHTHKDTRVCTHTYECIVIIIILTTVLSSSSSLIIIIFMITIIIIIIILLSISSSLHAHTSRLIFIDRVVGLSHLQLWYVYVCLVCLEWPGVPRVAWCA